MSLEQLLDEDDFKVWQELTNQIVDIVNTVGDSNSLTTSAQNSLVSSINELVTNIGNLNSLTTSAQNSLVSSINELVTAIDGLTIGEDVTASTEFLNSIVALGTVAQDKLIYSSSENTASAIDITSYTRGLIAASNYSEGISALGISDYFRLALNQDELSAKQALNLEIGVDVQGYDVNTVKKNVHNEYSKSQNFAASNENVSGNITWNLTDQEVKIITLTGNTTITSITNQKAGGTYILIVKQDITGSHSLNFPTEFKWVRNQVPFLTGTAASVDVFSFISDGTNLLGAEATGYTP